MADDEGPRVERLFRLFQRSGRSRRFERSFRRLSPREQDDLIHRIGQALLRLYRHEGRSRRFDSAYRQLPAWQQRELAEEILQEYRAEQEARAWGVGESRARREQDIETHERARAEFEAEQRRLHPPIGGRRIPGPPPTGRKAPPLPREHYTAEELAEEDARLQGTWGYNDEQWRALKMRWYLEHYQQEPELTFERFLELERYGRNVGHAGNRWPPDRIAVFNDSDGAFNFIRDRLDPLTKVFVSASGYLQYEYHGVIITKPSTWSLSGEFRFARDILLPQRMEAIQDFNKILFQLDPDTPAHRTANKWIVRWKAPGDKNYKSGRPPTPHGE